MGSESSGSKNKSQQFIHVHDNQNSLSKDKLFDERVIAFTSKT